MSHVRTALSKIGQTEAEVRRLMAEAAASGDYDAVVQLAAMARNLAGALAAAGSPTISPEPAPRPGPTQAPRAKKRARKSDYPRFHRDGDSIIKVGWSKSSKVEYEHRTTKHALLDVVTALQTAGRNGARITMEKILPVLDSTTGAELPTYQAYVCVGWLRDRGLLEQHGRQGYSIPKPTDFRDAVDREWTSLPSK